MTTGETTGHKQSTLRITGMTCAACANRIERGLSKLEGVAEANVNLALEKATVSYDPAKISVERIEQTIEKLGYGTVKATAELLLEGMTCAACANRIEKGLNQLPGVREAAVNFALETAHVVYSPAEVSLADIQQKVKQLGYQARPKEDAEQEDHRQKEIRKQKRRFILSALLSLPLLWSMVGHFSFTSWIYDAGAVHEPLVPAGPGDTGAVRHRRPVLYRRIQSAPQRQRQHGCADRPRHVGRLFLQPVSDAGLAYDRWSRHHGPALYYETSAVLITLMLLGKLLEAMAKGTNVGSDQVADGPAGEDGPGGPRRAGDDGSRGGGGGRGHRARPAGRKDAGRRRSCLKAIPPVDESMLTGESMPVEKQAGDHGHRRDDQQARHAAHPGDEGRQGDSAGADHQGRGGGARIEGADPAAWRTRISGIFVPIVVAHRALSRSWSGISSLIRAIWPVRWRRPSPCSSSLVPCALGLATPTSIMAGSGRAAELGILFKGGEHLEQTHQRRHRRAGQDRYDDEGTSRS